MTWMLTLFHTTLEGIYLSLSLSLLRELVNMISSIWKLPISSDGRYQQKRHKLCFLFLSKYLGVKVLLNSKVRLTQEEKVLPDAGENKLSKEKKRRQWSKGRKENAFKVVHNLTSILKGLQQQKFFSLFS